MSLSIDPHSDFFWTALSQIERYAILKICPLGRLQDWNRGTESILGYSPSDLTGRSIDSFYADQNLQVGEAWMIKQDQSLIWTSTIKQAVFDHQKKLVGSLLLIQDLTEQKEVLERFHHTLRSREEFISVAAHELRTPFTSLYLQLQLLRMQLEQRSPFEKMAATLKLCEQNGKKFLSLMEEILDVTRIRFGKMVLSKRPVDLTRLIVEVTDRFFKDASSKDQVRMNLEPRVMGLWDESRLEQALINLLSNAVRYGDQKPIQISLKSEGQQVILSIQDQGIGIPLEMQSKIFERFERASNSTHVKGLGLGLYLVQQIIQAHGGRVQVESEMGKGSTFQVFLPFELHQKMSLPEPSFFKNASIL